MRMRERVPLLRPLPRVRLLVVRLRLRALRGLLRVQLLPEPRGRGSRGLRCGCCCGCGCPAAGLVPVSVTLPVAVAGALGRCTRCHARLGSMCPCGLRKARRSCKRCRSAMSPRSSRQSDEQTNRRKVLPCWQMCGPRGQDSSQNKLRMARDAATQVVVIIRIHTAPAHVGQVARGSTCAAMAGCRWRSQEATACSATRARLGSYASAPLVSASQEALHVEDQRWQSWQFVRQHHARVLLAQPSKAAPPAAHPMLHRAHRTHELHPEASDRQTTGCRAHHHVRVSRTTDRCAHAFCQTPRESASTT